MKISLFWVFVLGLAVGLLALSVLGCGSRDQLVERNRHLERKVRLYEQFVEHTTQYARLEGRMLKLWEQWGSITDRELILVNRGDVSGVKACENEKRKFITEIYACVGKKGIVVGQMDTILLEIRQMDEMYNYGK